MRHLLQRARETVGASVHFANTTVGNSLVVMKTDIDKNREKGK